MRIVMTAKELSESYQSLSFQERLERLFEEFPQNKILVTSSFGTTSMVLLHLLSKVRPGHPVHFIDTSYHFPETLAYRDELVKGLGLNVVELKAKPKKNQFTKENQTWRFNQDLCCFINKVEPLDTIKPGYSIWVSGLMGFQNVHRKNLNLFQPRDGLLKFHPLIDMSKEDLNLYQQLFELPTHSLVHKGYNSVGCTHCTKKGQGREGRWLDVKKTECGLHDNQDWIKNRMAG
ncbi:MAG: phosphoadenylyl-sulfate reductase [Cyclobacteriaceae bacterium]|nr:MAG: phosphoadenylyl-sulfate reductase [Cyclobacteriaceae bacterium]